MEKRQTKMENDRESESEGGGVESQTATKRMEAMDVAHYQQTTPCLCNNSLYYTLIPSLHLI